MESIEKERIKGVETTDFSLRSEAVLRLKSFPMFCNPKVLSVDIIVNILRNLYDVSQIRLRIIPDEHNGDHITYQRIASLIAKVILNSIKEHFKGLVDSELSWFPIT